MLAPEKERVAETVPRAVIFESYGWGDAEEIAKRISSRKYSRKALKEIKAHRSLFSRSRLCLCLTSSRFL
jgi:hypothetical protein